MDPLTKIQDATPILLGLGFTADQIDAMSFNTTWSILSLLLEFPTFFQGKAITIDDETLIKIEFLLKNWATY